MTESQTFEQIEEELLAVTSPQEQKMLDALSSRDMDRYRDAVTELYMQRMFQAKIDKVIRSAMGHGQRKPGAHSEGKHK